MAGILVAIPNVSPAASVTPSKHSRPAQKKTAENAAICLPGNVLPINYELTFEPDQKTFQFDGQESITLSVERPTSEIVLNALELQIFDPSLQPAAKTSPPEKGSVLFDQAREQAKIIFKNQLAPGKYQFNCRFKGTLNDQLRGFYRSSYTYARGEKQWLFVTQMEPTDARRMFPSFDEPGFKATYRIRAVIDPQLTAISNAPVEREEMGKGGGKKTVVFETTPKMSSYLVALLIGNFKPSAARTVNGVAVRVWAPAGKEQLSNYPLNTACDLLPVLSGYFGVPYPAKKLDLIALPDFGAGAMENLGAITFREALLLVDEKTGSLVRKQVVAGIIAHEMAHQWFGDLVTMRWWDDLWLNEAFATWMATKAVNTVHPEWRFMTEALAERNLALGQDALRSTRAIHADVLNPSQAIEMFDGITYEKGASVLRMLESFVGEKPFRQGIHNYLSAHAYGNAATEDLWQAIGAASGQPVSTVMRSWVYQPGFPLITAARQKNGQISLSQDRYLAASDAKPENSLWQVPVVMRGLGTAGNGKTSSTQTTKLLSTWQQSCPVSPASRIVLVNKNGTGFYRVRYAASDFQALANSFENLSPEERLALLSDTGALSASGKVPVEEWLNLTLKVRQDKDPIVLRRLINDISGLYNAIDTGTMPSYAKLIAGKVLPLKQRLGWQAQAGEPEPTKDLRNAVLTILGTHGQDKRTIAEAYDLFSKYKQDREAIDPNLVLSMLNIVAFNGNEKEYEEIQSLWKAAKTPEEEKRDLYTLAAFRRPELIAKTLDLCLSTDVRTQDAPALLSKLLSSKDSQAQAWAFLQTRWNDIAKRYPPWTLRNLASSCGSFYHHSDEHDLQVFFTAHKVPYGENAVARMLEDVHINAFSHERNDARIRDWVKKKTADMQPRLKRPARAWPGQSFPSPQCRRTAAW